MKNEQCHHLTFLGSYFHQDWPLDYATVEDAIAAFESETEKQTLSAFCRELEEAIPWVAQLPEKDAEYFLWTTLRWEYVPRADGLSVVEWLRKEGRQLCNVSGRPK
jgi:hypothetical protein